MPRLGEGEVKTLTVGRAGNMLFHPVRASAFFFTTFIVNTPSVPTTQTLTKVLSGLGTN